MGADVVREARLQTLTQELDNMKVNKTETIDEYSNRLSGIASRYASLGEVVYEMRLVKKFLTSLPRRSDSYDNRKGDNVRGRGRGSYGNRSRGCGRSGSQDRERVHNEAASSSRTIKLKKDWSKLQCYRWSQIGHFTSMCPDRKPPKQQEANIDETKKANKVVYMHEMVHLNEERLRPNLYKNETNILGKATKSGFDVCMKNEFLTMRDIDGRLLMKTIIENDAWKWHARPGQRSFENLKTMAKREMVHGLPNIQHEDRLCESWLWGSKQGMHSKTQQHITQTGFWNSYMVIYAGP
ncbi:uncharacterized protein LOC143570146 [Bidens hawaiensis]|uniref:uncharacterized protein LOC143570146 n=1 Tax=Bidens hawaiensis TaxID=980011 RepID=UPI0040494CCD